MITATKLHGRPDAPEAHKHGACKHVCRCAASRAYECQKCSRDRFYREQAAKYAVRTSA